MKTESNNLVANIETHFASTEKNLNPYGYVPFLSNFSGAFRSVLGAVQFIAYTIFALLSLLKGCSALAERNFYAMCSGATNALRGFVESTPFIGNFACLVYDQLGYRIHYIEERSDPKAENLKAQSLIELQNHAPQLS